MHFAEEHCFGCASALHDCVDVNRELKNYILVDIIQLLIKHSPLGLIDITSLDGKDLKLTS